MIHLSVYVGFDSREPRTFEACVSSILTQNPDSDKIHVEVRGLSQKSLRESGIYYREVDELASTEFSLTRFLTPILASRLKIEKTYTEHWALFCDSDFIFTRPFSDLLRHRNHRKCVQVVKHSFEVSQAEKMDGAVQHSYPRKWWSALMLFNLNSIEVPISLDDVNSRSPAYLHQFKWVNDDLLGELPEDWHWLDGYSQPSLIPPSGIHYTLGSPELGRKVPWEELWWQALQGTLPMG